jgi:hypothetical protein
LRVSITRRASSSPAMANCSRANTTSPHTERDSSRGNKAVAAVQPSRRHTARNTLSVVRSPSAPTSSDLMSADFTG